MQIVVRPAFSTPRVGPDITFAQSSRLRQKRGTIIRTTALTEHVNRRNLAFDPITVMHKFPNPLPRVGTAQLTPKELAWLQANCHHVVAHRSTGGQSFTHFKRALSGDESQARSLGSTTDVVMETLKVGFFARGPTRSDSLSHVGRNPMVTFIRVAIVPEVIEVLYRAQRRSSPRHPPDHFGFTRDLGILSDVLRVGHSTLWSDIVITPLP